MKTKLVGLMLFLLCGCLPLIAQQEQKTKPIEKVGKDGIYLVVDKMPEFPGGSEALIKYLRESIKYPVEAQKNKIQGRVIIQFVVKEDGSLDMVKVARGVDPLLDAEALRVVETMPKWIPGVEKGVPVKVRFTVPIMFSLNTPMPNQLRGFLVPIKEDISNKTIEGVWQSCTINREENGYRVTLAPILKILSTDKTFMNLYTGNVQISAAVLVQGKYEMKTDNMYEETIGQTLGGGPFTVGTANEITFQFLSDKLVKFTFMVPGREEPWEEYWFRVPMPGDSGFGSTTLMAN